MNLHRLMIRQRAIQLAKDTSNLYKDLSLNEDGVIDPEIVSILSVPLCRLVKVIIPNVHQKIDEIIYASENNLIVNSKQHGPDLKNHEGDCIELKVSVVTSKSKRCNFNWNVPKEKKGMTRRETLINSVKEKTKGGGACFIIKDGLGNELKRYNFSEGFLLGFFNNVKIGGDNINMGCQRCTKCKKFHKLDKMQEYNNLFEKDNSSINWDNVLNPEISCE